MLTIDRVLWLLGDGKWHHMSEIVANRLAKESSSKIVLSFLREYDFIKVSEDEQKLRLSASMLSFITRIQQIEIEESLREEGLKRTIRIKNFESPLSRSRKS